MSFFNLIILLTISFGFAIPDQIAHGDIHHHANHLHLDGSSISVLWIIPFLGILLSIAIFPLISSSFWHHNYGKISAFWGIVFLFLFT